jgi:parvulin-like peptidyl-prolyl isomerase
MRRAALGLALAWLACSACQPGASDDAPVATVNAQPIALGELRRAVEVRLGENAELAREQALAEELDRLVSEQIVLQRAGALGLEVSDADVEQRLAQLHGDDFKDPDPEYREQVRRRMLLDRTALLDLAERVRVPENSALLYFEEHRERFRQAEKVQVRQIVVEERAKAEQLRARLERGEDFATLAADYSLAPEAHGGGLLPAFARGEMPEAFDEAFGLAPGQVSRVIESPFGFHLFKLEARLAPRDPEFAEVREAIMLELEQDRLDELRREWLRELRREAEVQVNERLMEKLR